MGAGPPAPHVDGSDLVPGADDAFFSPMLDHVAGADLHGKAKRVTIGVGSNTFSLKVSRANRSLLIASRACRTSG